MSDTTSVANLPLDTATSSPEFDDELADDLAVLLDDDDEDDDDEIALAAVDDAIAETQALVPWKVVAADRWGSYDQQRQIEAWADDKGRYPRTYRAYSREEWQQAIKTLADTVTDLPKSDPEYQHLTGLYVEGQSDTTLLIVGKRWQVFIQIPSRVSKSGQRIEVSAPAGRDNYMFSQDRPKAFAEFLMTHVPEGQRDTLLDICCQYIREIRVVVNRTTWAAENPELAHLLDEKKN